MSISRSRSKLAPLIYQGLNTEANDRILNNTHAFGSGRFFTTGILYHAETREQLEAFTARSDGPFTLLLPYSLLQLFTPTSHLAGLILYKRGRPPPGLDLSTDPVCQNCYTSQVWNPSVPFFQLTIYFSSVFLLPCFSPGNRPKL